MRLLALAFVICTTAAAESVLYGTINPPEFVRISTKSGAVKGLTGNIGKEGQAQELSAFDVKSSTYYILGYNFTDSRANLVGFNVDKMAVVSDVQLPFVEDDLVGVGQSLTVDSSNGDVYCSGRLSATGNHTVLKVNPRSGVVEHVGQIGDLDVLGGAAAFDPKTRRLYLTLATPQHNITTGAVDVDTGAVSFLPNNSPDQLSTMDFDVNTGKIVGMGIDITPSRSLLRTVLSLDPSSNTITRIGVVEGYVDILGDIASFDSSSNTIVTVLQKTNSNDTAPFFLVSIDASTAVVTHSASLGSIGGPTTPWSLEFAS